jgi:hypothetical protein
MIQGIFKEDACAARPVAAHALQPLLPKKLPKEPLLPKKLPKEVFNELK